MSPAGPIAVVVSCGVHLALLTSVWGTPPAPAPRTPSQAAIEVEVRSTKVEPPPPPPAKHETPPPLARRRGSAPSLPPVTAVEVSSPVVAAVGGVPGEQPPVPGGSGGTDDEGAVVVSKPPPPPPPPDTSVELLFLPRIVYPKSAHADGVEGRVRLWVQLDETGRVLSVDVLDEPGSGLGAAARKALLDATFKPPTHLGLREATAFEYVYRFQLL